MFITLRKYLYGGSPKSGAGEEQIGEFCSALAEFARKAIRGAAELMRDGGEPGIETLRGRIRDLGSQLEEAAAPGDIVGIGDRFAVILTDYWKLRAEAEIERDAEFQKIVSMLNQTVMVLSAGSRRSVARLKKIEKGIESATRLQDIATLKAQLSDCLSFVREETAREREEVARTVLIMEAEINKAKQSVELANSGLPGRAEAERVLASSLDSDRVADLYAAVFTLDRLDSIYSRFGSAVGDQAFRDFVGRLLLSLDVPKQVFQWDDCSVLAVLERAAPVGGVRAEMQRLSAEPLDVNVEVGGRMAVLSLVSRWLVLALAGARSPDWLINEIDSFSGQRL